jgi:hypothetical protein
VADFWLKAGDLVPSITSTLVDGNGQPIDILGADVTFIMRAFEGAIPTVQAPATNLQMAGQDDTIGKVAYEWTAGDTDVPGGYRAEWQVEFADGRGTVPNDEYKLIAILPSLAEVP